MRARAAMKARHPTYPDCMHPRLRPTGVLEGDRPAYPGVDGRPLGGRVIISEGFCDGVAQGKIATVPGYITAADASSVTVSCDGEPADVRVRADAVIVCTGYLPPTPRVTRVMEPQPKSCELLYKVVPRSVDVDRDDASERTVFGGAFRGTTFGGSVRGAATHPDRSIAIERPPCTNSQRVAVVGSTPPISRVVPSHVQSPRPSQPPRRARD